MRRAEDDEESGDGPSTLLQILHTLPTAAYLCDADGLITYYNRCATEIWGRVPRLRDEADRYCGAVRAFHEDGSPMPRDQGWMALALRHERPYTASEMVIERPDGSRRWVVSHAIPLRDRQGRVCGGANVMVDLTESKQIKASLDYHASHDPLTGLPNRLNFLRELDRLLETARGSSSTFSLLVLDLDRFKEINDTFGPEYGDEVLRQVRFRLQTCVQETDLIARTGGDEFVILLPGSAEDGAANVSETIAHAMKRPIVCLDRVFNVKISTGLAVHPDHGATAAALLGHADLAMSAQRCARRHSIVDEERVSQTNAGQFSWSFRLRQAIENQEMVLHFQPKLDLRTRQIAGVEALVRWSHPNRGLLEPAEFLPLAEKAGLMKMIDLWVVRAALAQSHVWRQEGKPINIAVNLAPESLQDTSVLDALIKLLRCTPGAGLTVEITERAVLADPPIARANLMRLRALGVRVALDDFGTGFSSLAHLRELPVDELKIDQSFVEHLSEGRQDACIVRSVIALGHDLGLCVVVEGVENETVLNLLAGWGCDQIQGFYLSPPLPPSRLASWIKDQPHPHRQEVLGRTFSRPLRRDHDHSHQGQISRIIPHPTPSMISTPLDVGS